MKKVGPSLKPFKGAVAMTDEKGGSVHSDQTCTSFNTTLARTKKIQYLNKSCQTGLDQLILVRHGSDTTFFVLQDGSTVGALDETRGPGTRVGPVRQGPTDVFVNEEHYDDGNGDNILLFMSYVICRLDIL